MLNQTELTKIYRENLEEGIIRHLAHIRSLDLRKAMDIYYHSRLARQIQAGAYGIDNMDAKYLAEDLVEFEPELFQ